MAKKKLHKYKLGDTMKFRFFDGSVHVGKVAELRYSGDMWEHTETNYVDPQYSIHVPDTSGKYARGYMIYSNISDHRIISVNGDLKAPSFPESHGLLGGNLADVHMRDAIETPRNELQDAIDKQKDFIAGKIKKQ